MLASPADRGIKIHFISVVEGENQLLPRAPLATLDDVSQHSILSKNNVVALFVATNASLLGLLGKIKV